MKRFSLKRHVTFAAFFMTAIIVGAVFFAPLRSLADSWYGSFMRDANYYLDVNCKVGCAGATPIPYPTSTPGGVLKANPADATGASFTAANPLPVTTPPPTTTAAPGYFRQMNFNTTDVAGVLPNNTQTMALCDPNLSFGAGNCAGIGNPSDSNVGFGPSFSAYIRSFAFNGSNYDVIRKDTYANGPVWETDGGKSASSAASAATTVIKASAGRLAKLLVTTTGTGIFTCFDNASTGSGTVIGALPASAAVGTVEPVSMPAANGITCVSAASGPVVTVSYY